MKAITKERLAEAQSTGPKLCVDLSMTDSMSDKVSISKSLLLRINTCLHESNSLHCACLSDSGDKPTGRSAKKAVRVEQEGDGTVSPFPDGPEREQSSLQRVPSNERRLPQLHGDYGCSHSGFTGKHI